MENKPTKKKGRLAGVVKSVVKGRMYITATFNNTLATFTDSEGNTVCWGSTGTAGFSGSKKSTPYAATVAITKVLDDAKKYAVREIVVYIMGRYLGPKNKKARRIGKDLELTSSVQKLQKRLAIPPGQHGRHGRG